MRNFCENIEPTVSLSAGTRDANAPGMALPRCVVPGASYLLSRRVYQRTFRLRPHPVTNSIAEYCLAWAAAKTGMLLHSVVVMSDHEQIVATDQQGLLPVFLRELHRTMAKALNAAQGQWENLWSLEHTSVVLLPTVDAVLDEIAYVAANPVAAGQVEQPDQWPGVVQWRPGTTRVARRPDVYFDPHGTAPESVELKLVTPPQVEDSEEQWAERVRRAVAEKVRKAQEKVRASGKSFAGAAAVKARSFLDRAKSYEQKRRINPILAAKDALVRMKCLRDHRQFQRAYRAALLAWQAGDRLVSFPIGTWWMRVHHAARVLAPPG